MKKLISLLLVILMLCSVSAVTVSAEPFDKHVVGMNNGYEICVVNPNPSLPRETDEFIGDYYFTCGSQPSGLSIGGKLAVYAIKESEIIYIKTAYEQGLVDIEEIARMLNGYVCYVGGSVAAAYDAYLLGDTNRNWNLEIADAVIIQKFIAKKIYINMGIICDLNKDGDINIEDVLLLQKKIAKIVP